MASPWPRILLDPIHKIIPFHDNETDHLLLRLINTREFQRLRRIKQLGMSELVFPGANHTRFAHCIGVMHVTRMFVSRLEQLDGGNVTPQQRMLLSVAALVHDVGHGPFSHAFEKVTKENHERRTVQIILDDSTELNRVLRDIDPAFPAAVADVFTSTSLGQLPRSLTSVISSQMDADRFDYLLRDSYATGTGYGDFELQWLLQHIEVDSKHSQLYVNRKAIITAEAYVAARYHMYRIVYFHKTTRAGEVMLRLVLNRYKELLGNAQSASEVASIAPGAPLVLQSAFSGAMTLQQYLELDDSTLVQFFKACEQANDNVLNSLGSGLLNRRLYKGLDVTAIEDPAAVADLKAAVDSALRAANISEEYSFVSDSISDTPYKPYQPLRDQPQTMIYVESGQGSLRELSEISGPVQALKQRYNLLRYYYPPHLRETVERVTARFYQRQ